MFSGWPGAALDFYRELERDNTRAFWLAHRDVYERDVKAPFEALSELVAGEFGPLRMFRPNRDVRFSKDKSPYKTRGYAVTEGDGGEAYYVEISAMGLVVASPNTLSEEPAPHPHASPSRTAVHTTSAFDASKPGNVRSGTVWVDTGQVVASS